MKFRCFFLALCAVLAGCSTAPKRPESPARGDYTYAKEYVSWLARKEMQRREVTGLSIALVDDQRVVWAEGFGYADQAHSIKATSETVYRVGSVSKLFTATAAMQLGEEGKLDIDQPLKAYLPGFSIRSRFPDVGPVTPRSLMTHHSGIPSDLLKGMWTRNPEPFTNVVNRIRDEYAAHPPNTVFSYSNLGVTLLGHALENVAGRDFPSHMDASLLRPLGMTHSSFSTGGDRSPLASKGYRNGKEAEETHLRDIPAAGLNSSVLDLSRFLRMVFGGGRVGTRQILQPGTLAEMLRPQNVDVPLDLDLRVGLGWALSGLGDIDIKNAGPVAHHSGATLHHRSMVIILPAHKLGVVVLANASTAGYVVNKVATGALKLALEAKTGIRQPERKKPEEGGESPPKETLRAYEGRYATNAGVVAVRETSGGLRAEVMNRTFRLAPRADGLLALRYRILGLFPVSLGDLDHVGVARATIAGREILKVRMDGQELLVGQRIRPVPISGKWLERAGEYEITNPGEDTVLLETMRLRQDGGLLLADFSMPLFHKGTLSYAIGPISDTEAVIYGLGRGLGETIRVDTIDGKEVVGYSGYLLRRKNNP